MQTPKKSRQKKEKLIPNKKKKEQENAVNQHEESLNGGIPDVDFKKLLGCG